MRGHPELIRMRMAGLKPRGLWVCYGIDHSRSWEAWSKAGDNWPYPEIEIQPIENINQLDLRFAVGLTVHISSSESLPKLKKIHSAFVDAKAKSVFLAHNKYLIMPSGEILE